MEKTVEKWQRWPDEWLKQERKNTTKPLRGLRPNIPSSIPGECEQCVSVCVCVVVLKRAYEGVDELLAVLVLVVHNTFEPEAGEVLEDEVIVLRDAAWRMKRTSFIVKGSKQHQHITCVNWACVKFSTSRRCCKRLQMFLLPFWTFPETDGSS